MKKDKISNFCIVARLIHKKGFDWYPTNVGDKEVFIFERRGKYESDGTHSGAFLIKLEKYSGKYYITINKDEDGKDERNTGYSMMEPDSGYKLTIATIDISHDGKNTRKTVQNRLLNILDMSPGNPAANGATNGAASSSS